MCVCGRGGGGGGENGDDGGEVFIPSLLSPHLVYFEGCCHVCWLLNVLVTCWCLSGMDLLRQLCVLPH